MARTNELRQTRELFVNLTQRELRGKYKRTVFGQLWSLANPIALMIVYTFVFSFVLRIEVPPGDPSGVDIFSVWLLCGLIPWIFFANVVNQGMGALVQNESLIKKVYFPRSVLVFSTTASISLNWAAEMAVVVLVIVLVGAWTVLLWLPLIVVFMVLLAVFSVGLALMLSIANVYFRDTQYFVTILLQLGLYLTPVVYPLSLVEEQSAAFGPLFGSVTLMDIYTLNPMERFVQVFRSLLYDNTWPNPGDAIACVLFAAMSLALGWLVFRRHERKLAELL